jgi:hypothetical protein
MRMPNPSRTDPQNTLNMQAPKNTRMRMRLLFDSSRLTCSPVIIPALCCFTGVSLREPDPLLGKKGRSVAANFLDAAPWEFKDSSHVESPPKVLLLRVAATVLFFRCFSSLIMIVTDWMARADKCAANK